MRVEELTLTCSFFKYSNKLQRRNHSNTRTTKVHTKHAQPQQQNTLNPNNKTRSTPITKHAQPQQQITVYEPVQVDV